MNVMFKRGAQADLQKYILGTTQAVEGSFYLTSDTNRLYIGKKDSDNKIKAFPVNQGVISVDSIGSLPNAANAEAGQFYYVSGANILCVHNGKQWVQINPDTNTYITGRTNAGSTDTTNGFVVITDSIVQQEESGGALSTDKETFATKFAVQGNDGVNVTIDTYKDGTIERPVIKISQDPYTISDSVDGTGKKYTLTITDGHSSSDVTLTGGTNITFTEDSNGAVTVNSKNTDLNKNASGSSANNTLSFDTTGKLTSTITDSAGNYVSANVTPTIKYAPGADGTATETAVFKSGTAELSVYSKAQIDEKLRILDAMTYRGTVGETGKFTSLPTSEVRLGDTFKFVSKDYVNGVAVKIGDIVIADGAEDPSTGYITGTIAWEIVPSGDDSQKDTTYWTQSIEAGTILVEADGGNGASKGGIQIVDKDSTDASDIATYLTVENESTINTGANNTVNKVVIKHKEQEDTSIVNGSGVTNADTSDASQSIGNNFTVTVPVLSYDKAGHITKIDSKNYTVRDTINQYELEYLKITSAATTDDASTGLLSATATVQASLKDNINSTADRPSFNITSSTVTLNASGDHLVMDIVWGEFN